ncbi:MAG: alpha/beta hydrolase [Bacteroidia bacterium]|nr:MAG: alpha/beta hydrolase [Bacteroidia bacterium]
MKLHFRKYGEGSPLIILHGLFGQSDNWNTLAKKFAEHNLQVYAVDLRNHGLSPHSEEMSYELMAKDVNELVLSENLQHPILMGHSMGGKVAMWYDYLFPHSLWKLIVVDIAPKQYKPGHEDVFKALNAVDFNIVKNRKEAELILRNYLKDEGVIQFLLKNIYWETSEKLNWRFNLKSIQKHYDEILKAIPDYVSSTKTIFIRGEKSAYITDDDWNKIQKIYSNVQLITIPDAGHWVHAEQPQKFLDEIFKKMQK